MRIASLNEHLTWKSYKLVVFLSLRIFIFLLRSITKPRLRYVDNVPDFTPKYSVAILRTTNSVGFSTESCWRKRQKGTRFQRRHAKTNCLYAANLVVSFAFVSLSAMINVSYFSMYVYMYNILVLFFCLCIDPAYHIKLQLWCVIVMVRVTICQQRNMYIFVNHELHDIAELSRENCYFDTFAEAKNFVKSFSIYNSILCLIT